MWIFGLAITLFWFLILGILIRRLYLGKITRVTLLPYQKGIFYKKGLPIREVGPGRSRVRVGIEKVIIVDARPIPLSFENRAVTLRDGANAIYSLSATAEVIDTRKALYSCQNFVQYPAFTLLCCARLVLSSCSSSQLKINKDAMTEKIRATVQERLHPHGFQLTAFRVTQLNYGSIPADNL